MSVKNKTFLGIFVLATPILFISIFRNSFESSLCEQFKSTYSKSINGQVIDIYYIDLNGRKTGCVDILDEHKQKYTFRSFHNKEGYKNIQKGDSIFKFDNSATFIFYRNGIELVNINWDVGCENTFKEFHENE